MSNKPSTAGALSPVEPEGWRRGSGYSNGMLAPGGGRLLFVAGQIGWDRNHRIVGHGFVDQFAQALRNAMAVVREAGGEAGHIGRLTVYVTDKEEYSNRLAAVGEAFKAVMGRHYPAMSLVEVAGLLEPGAKVEIEATAVLPAIADVADVADVADDAEEEEE